ncbi:helix-turn-helix domain-containing protein [Actinomadura fibrosa]|uniref:Helix-turn-helix domain-containing protein n=1 Tax=Actinomadura fibrosa TaxID=111802 RepID=A0ABW2XH47_9ACTN|nr:helix-turn-helix transcriptional regulator [Actinomadura fibrosa]
MTAGQGERARRPAEVTAQGPTASRLLLGARLRELREGRGIGRSTAGYAIRASHSKISRMELGRTSFKARDVADLLDLYGVTDEEERAALMRLARDGNARGWWHRYSDTVPTWTHSFLDLEEAADVVRTYDPCQIPELLQTEEYARAALSVRESIEPEGRRAELDDRLTVRLLRQRQFHRSPDRTLAAIVDEAALLRFVGGRGVIRRQLEHLLGLGDRTGVELRIIPVGGAALLPVGQPFTVLRFEQRAIPDVVYLEFLATALYLDRPAEVDDYEQAWTRLAEEALPVDESRVLLRDLLGTL